MRQARRFISQGRRREVALDRSRVRHTSRDRLPGLRSGAAEPSKARCAASRRGGGVPRRSNRNRCSLGMHNSW
jgi:hypothetical protein